MGSRIPKPTAHVVETRPATVSGTAAKHPVSKALRALVGRITTPLLPDDYLRLANPLWSARELRGRIIDIRRETTDSATLVIKPGWGFEFDYEPGQYIGIGVLVDGRWRWRSYSLTSSPVTSRAGAAGPATSRAGAAGPATSRAGAAGPATSRAGAAGPATSRHARTITITVKAMPEGFLSTHLVVGVAPGTVVRLAAPQGNFVMPDPAPPSVLFLTGGSGITPVMSMLRTLVRREQVTDVLHIHSAPTESDVMFAAELEQLARDHPGYRIVVRTTRTQGRLDLRRLADDVPDWRERETWACGPQGMLEAAERVWADAGIAARLRLERFAVTRTPARAGDIELGGTVTFARSGKKVAADGATSLMDAGENVGVQMPFGCRMGICQSCVVSLVDGHVRDLRSGVEHEPGMRVQTCISAASGDCVLDV